jgi:CPA2 family monovalent cation:H+ antiporter-2
MSANLELDVTADLRLLGDLVLATLAAFAGGLLAQWLRQPVILGYLLAGVAIGPATPGPIADPHSVQVLAELGVAFLMFAVGAEFSPAELKRSGRIAVLGGIAQILLTTTLGAAVAPMLGLDLPQGIFLGALLALSSTVVAIKLLQARGETGTLHGHTTLGFLILQDLAVVPMVIFLPVLAGRDVAPMSDLVATIAKAVVLLGATYLVGVRLVPRLLERAATARSRELFLLGVVSLALGTAIAAQAAGLSLAVGAFLAGLVISESDYAPQVVAEVLPLRDLFASLFFVSVGMLVDPANLVANAGSLVPLLFVAIVGKTAIVTGLVVALGMPGRVALLTGLALGQIGEFSFVLARLGVDRGALSSRVFDLVLGAALVTIVVSPWLLQSNSVLLAWLARVPRLGRAFADPVEGPGEEGVRLSGHTIICGYGRVGHELVDALRSRGIGMLVIEYNPQVVAELRKEGVPVIYGDAANPAVLARAHLERARVLAVTLPDPSAAARIVRQARSLSRRLDIIARSEGRADLVRLRRSGASDVVQPQFEGGVEFIRHTMRRYGVLGTELQALAAGRRAAYYTHALEEQN